ncbi:uncharacterized protein LOC131293223 [Anopheles ziemanni]|uniref:uncharacterized protein LOC131264112 n=1 Tax=Anopheles coustani TaxID=139045 RepID=UPI002659C57B|nr:uncharacterized protein LOC131264112 [Anopheles coustani]XP_058177286.1 uncharacterized protein LOC131293223 [Anopheles ziemanni]
MQLSRHPNLVLATMLVALITLSTETSEDFVSRQKRFLLFPRANPGRLQFIGGFGIPVDLQLESITVGYVFKSVYLLPWNSSHWIHPFLDRHELETQRADGVRRRRDTWQTPLRMADEKYEHYNDEQEQESGNALLPGHYTKDSRWTFYHILEQLFNQKGLNGRSCVLRTICESSDAGFTHSSGLVGELLHIAFTPSTTEDTVRESHHESYRQAEKIPRQVSVRAGGSVCAEMYAECTVSLLDSFSNVFNGIFGGM